MKLLTEELRATLTLRLRGNYDSVVKVAAGASLGNVVNLVTYQLAQADTVQASDYAAEVEMQWSNGVVRTSNLLALSIVSDVG